MAAIKGRYIAVAVIGCVSLTGAALYWQYKKLMDYCLGFKSLKVKTISRTFINVDLFLTFKNKSKLSFTVDSQEYIVYLNNIFITKVENNSSNFIKADDTSIVGVNVQFNPDKVMKDIAKNAVELAALADKMKVKFDMKLKIKLWGLIPITIPYIYEATLKEFFAPVPKNPDGSNPNEC